ncbi:hypothetical protein CBQ26_00525 [Deinococcus indicus]|uniref:SGNH hydrolase-type esterase domain-containing protein n=1 Tax=Deinococcus indicus TaxID=223556 RepID=A0A246BTI2_9DEIO|nr:hypothetical protein CBQ26_00525 [Deinococcus indicus]
MPVVAPSPIWMIGDSLTIGAGATSEATRIYTHVRTLTGRTVVVDAQGGTTSTAIAARVGALPVTVAAPGGLPQSGSVEVIPSVRLLDGAGNDRRLTVTVGGVTGTLVHSNHNPDGSLNAAQPYVFQRAAAGAAINPGVYPLAVPLGERPTHTTIIWAGRNNYAQTDTVVQDVRAIVATLKTPRYIVLSVLNGRGEVRGTNAHAAIQRTNVALASAFGERFVDVRAALVGTAADDTVPEALRFDGIHLNDAGQLLAAQTVVGALKRLNY